MKQWPDIECTVTSPLMSYEEYIEGVNSKDRFLSTMIGDLLRIREYPKLGFQIEQEIPDDVWQAGQELLKLGYDKYKLK
jgi:ribosome-binding factor A